MKLSDERLITLSSRLVIVAILVFVAGLYYFFDSPKSLGLADGQIKTGITERDLVINNLSKESVKDYSYDSRFIPGLGYISDPEAYKNSWESSQE